MDTRNKVNKSLPVGGPSFTSISHFDDGYLPTKKDVIERVLHEKNYRTLATAKNIASELISVWIKCNVYTKSILVVTQRIYDVMAKFSEIMRYPKSRRKSTSFIKKKLEITKDLNQLFDIFCEDKVQRKKIEKNYLLQMSEEDFEFYNDQKAARKFKCLKEIVPLTTKDIKFQKRYRKQQEKNSNVLEQEKKEQNKEKEEEPGTSTAVICSNPSSLPAPPASTPAASPPPSLSSSSPPEEYPTPYFVTENKQNSKHIPTIVSACERFQLSDRAGAAVATGTLVDYGYVSNKNKKNIIDRSKIRRERQKYRKEIIKKESMFFNITDGIFIDGRKDATLSMREKKRTFLSKNNFRRALRYDR